jgi:hypothetical protein
MGGTESSEVVNQIRVESMFININIWTLGFWIIDVWCKYVSSLTRLAALMELDLLILLDHLSLVRF